jgi:transposase
MTNKKSNITRQKYSAQFKEQALERSKKDGVPKVAKDLGIAAAIIYSWKKKQEQTGIPFEDQRLQAAEMARLKREVARLSEECAFLKKAAAYFAKEPK